MFNAKLDDGTVKVWAIGADLRGVHTFFTEPGGSKLIYYFKPLVTDFNNKSFEATKYMDKKMKEKKLKGYTCISKYCLKKSTKDFK